MAKVKRGIKAKKKDILAAIDSCGGIITTACEKVPDVSRTQFYRWLEQDHKFKEAVDSATEKIIDLAESSLIRNIRNGDTTSIIFYLKTKGKKRGYSQSVDVSGTIEHKPISGISIEVKERKLLPNRNIIDER